MKLLHLADLHGNRERADELLQSLAVARKSAQGVDLIAIAGDIWDAVVQNTDGSRFNDIREGIRALADVAPVVIIYGTPTHDAAGSLDVFPSLASKFGITILEPDLQYFLGTLAGKLGVFEGECDDARALLFGVPEPSKKWLAAYTDTKAEAEQAVRDGLRGLFTGLGAIRRQYPSLPCVMLYHGQVGGARLQNGDLLDNGSGIRPSIDDLAAVGADYIAAGDIHEPQRVGESIGLPFYYPGSAYPINFGETHEVGANLVEISRHTTDGAELFGSPDGSEGFSHRVTRVPFGHPVNRKVGFRWPDGFPVNLVVKGARMWIEITCTKEESVSIDTEFFMEQLQAAGAAPGSRVTLNVLPTETVRAGDITSKTQLRDKVTVWGENSSKAIPAGVLTKADEVEAEAARTGAVGKGQRIVLNRLVLRGAIGLKKKSGLEEVDFNLDEIDAGLVALIGGNGAGKTTLLENLHPWPGLLTREGTLKDHFYLRDSFRDLYWTDVATGTKYRAMITINAATASGTTEYYLWADGQPLPGIEGRKEGYVEAVDRLFGSKELYLRSAFVTQRQPKNLPDLADATPGQRKALFSALCGTDYLEAFKLIAKGRGDQSEGQQGAKEAEINVLTARLPVREDLEWQIEDLGRIVESAREDLGILAEVGKHKTKAVDALSAQAESNAQRFRQAREAEDLTMDANSRAIAARADIESAQQAVKARPAAVDTLAKFNALSAQLTTQNEAYARHMEAVAEERKVVDAARDVHEQGRQVVNEKNQERLAAHQGQVKEMTRNMDEILRRYTAARDTEVRLQHRIEHLEGQLKAPVAEMCPTCGQGLPADALETVRKGRAELEASLDEARNLLAAASSTTQELDRQYSTAKTARDTLPAPAQETYPSFTPPPSTVPAWNDTERQRIKGELLWIDEAQARATIAAADVAQVRIEELTKQLADLQATADRERRRAEELRAGLRPELDAELAEARHSLEAARSAYRDAQGREARAVAALEQAQQRLTDLAKDLQAVDELKAALAKLQVETAEWRLLEFACSDKGIQALELDAVAPSIMAIANDLLKGAFGSRYQLEARTTRLSGSGKAQKQIEDFLIDVLDTETGEAQEIATLSGGEAVWIRRALYDAFGIIRARSTGLQFLTVFQDEADGALDPEQKLTYFRMLQAAHAQSGRRHTVLISHDQGIQELVGSRVEVRRLRPRKEAVAA
jgi:exonuclease SbcC